MPGGSGTADVNHTPRGPRRKALGLWSPSTQPQAMIPMMVMMMMMQTTLAHIRIQVWPLDSVLNYKLMHFQINKRELWRKRKGGKDL